MLNECMSEGALSWLTAVCMRCITVLIYDSYTINMTLILGQPGHQHRADADRGNMEPYSTTSGYTRR